MTPIRATLFYGLLCALCFIPFVYGPAAYWGVNLSYKMFFFVNLVVYCLFLCRWGNKPLISIIFSLLLLTTLVLWPDGPSGITLIALCIFSWIRSGICFSHAPVRAMFAEFVTMACGVGFALFWWPHSTLIMPLTIWFFFLVQTLYFFIVPLPPSMNKSSSSADSFDYSRRELERLLENNISI